MRFDFEGLVDKWGLRSFLQEQITLEITPMIHVVFTCKTFYFGEVPRGGVDWSK